MMTWWIWALALLILIVIIAWLWKIVMVPTLTVTTDKDSYDRTETVHISGNLSDVTGPLQGKTAKIAVEPPSGDVYILPDVITDEAGDYSADWDVPDEAVAGTYALTVASLGVSASKTFTQISLAMVLRV